jgi:hypothetical protein
VPEGRAIAGGYERVRLAASAEVLEMAVSLSMEKLCQLSAQLHVCVRRRVDTTSATLQHSESTKL